MKNAARKKRLEEVEPAQLTLADVINAGLHEFVIAASTAALGTRHYGGGSYSSNSPAAGR